MIDPSQALELCEKTTKCPGEYHNLPPEHSNESYHCLARNTRAPLPSCDGTGRVPLLDPEKVRDMCPPVRHGSCVHGLYSQCRGRGWTPSTDPWDYVRAAWKQVEFANQLRASVTRALGEDVDPGPAVFGVVYRVLVKEGL